MRNTPKIRFKGFSDDWEQRKLGEIMSVKSVKRIMQSDWLASGIRFLRARDIVAASKNEDPSDFLYISEEKYEEYSKLSGKVSIGDLLVTGVGTIGIPYLVRTNEPIYFKDGNIIWFQNEAKIDSNFLFYSFTSNSIQSFIKDSSGIGTVGTFTIENGKKVPLCFPLQQEQKSIGLFFSNLDNLITLHQRKGDALKKIKQALLQKLFPENGSLIPEIRFKGFSDAWEQRKLGDVAVLSKGQGYSKEDVKGKGTPIILYGRLYTKYETIVDKVDTFVEQKVPSVVSTGREVVVPASGETAEDISRASAISVPGIIIGGDLNVITPSSGLDSIFLALTISNGHCQKELSKKAQGKTIVHLHNEDISLLNILYPTIEEQNRIAKCLKKLDYLITLHQRKCDSLKKLKQSLLQKMFV